MNIGEISYRVRAECYALFSAEVKNAYKFTPSPFQSEMCPHYLLRN